MQRSTMVGLAAGAAAIALIAGVSVVWPGLDAQETQKTDTAVWALQTGDGRRYARVNTTIGELDTVREISNPSAVVQTGDGAYLFSDSLSRLTPIDSALPADLDDEALRTSAKTPDGTIEITAAEDFVAYRTDTGAVYAGRLSTGDSAVQLDPFRSGDDDAPQYSAEAIAVDARGMLFSYSQTDGSVLRYDIPASEVRGRDPAVLTGVTRPAITAAGDDWAVVDLDDGDVWLAQADAAVVTPTEGTVVVGKPDPTGEDIFVADQGGLVSVAVDGSGVSIEVPSGPAILGVPARPIVHDGEVYAAWLPQGEGAGVLWSSSAGRLPLDYGGKELPDLRRPAFVASDDAVILNEIRSGWVWTVADAALVASSQDWTLDENLDPDAEESDEQLSVVVDPRPPVAEADVFGVRAGRLSSLAVLLNDHDPNEDVLSIDPLSVKGLDPAFGVVSITDDSQRLSVRVAPGAAGSASFEYAVTDGTADGGLLSAPTTVTLTVAGTEVQSAPGWCAVPGCLASWPTPEVARGGTITVPVLPGWVDPDGDPLLLLSVQNSSGVGRVAAAPSGEVIYQHSDDGVGGDQLITLTVTVADTAGQTATKPLVVKVSDDPDLSVQSFAVVDTIDAGLTVDVTDHVTGSAGTISLSAVRILDDADASATIVGGSASFDFSAQTPGTFLVGFTATDGRSDATGTARITILPAEAPPQLATSPVVAFVHPQEDVTLDVFAAVENPTRRVLLLSDVVGHADPGATLSVDAVGQDHLRVSGATISGAAGRLGTVTYVISDGTDDQGARVEGEATVFLLPPAPELAPIAVDDAVVVRAGSQIDIPVLVNDIAAAGGMPTLNPASILSSSAAALAFAGGDVLRYLAPNEPGSYEVQYGIYTTGAPALTDAATVRITVLGDAANRAPLPDTLEGRVLSGQTTAIDFDGFGVDPDGDAVMLDRVITQPENGSAAVSADGASILYTSVAGDSGQASFRYRVVDAFGQSGEGTVRVGVLDAQSNPSPITFTDYVQVQAGADSTIRVSPLANDVDPTMGQLTITQVRPDLPPTLADGTASEDYARLDAHLESVSESTVVIAAGEEPTTLSYLYDVESSSGNTGRGLIVVRVVRESVPDYPVVTDTVLTAETRDDFRGGVDVLATKASWSGGAVEELSVALWGNQPGVVVDGAELSGTLPATSRVIPFAVSGLGASGEVTTYAFLRIPGDDEMTLALRSASASPVVDELAAVSFDMTNLISKPRGARIELGEDIRASGARTEAACQVQSGTTVEYEAGAGAPWTDACEVPVRIVGQQDWTYLSVPITVQALDPQPVLRAGSLTVGPGESATFDLRNMTTWQLREDWDGIVYAIDYTGNAFDVSLTGSIVTAVGRDRAVPGTEEAAIVSITSHGAVAPVRLILRVGTAPSVLPQGGSVTQQCSQAADSSCTFAVVGAGGEVNPLPRTALTVTAVRPVGACTGVSFAVASATTVRASWSADAPGATCSATFSVQDAQERSTNAERDGRILLDLQGYPRAPASIAQTAFADGQVLLRIDPGEAALAYPALTGFVVRVGGVDLAQCAPDGSCPPIPAPNGEQRTYEAFALNSVGTSRTGVRTLAWAYDPPPPPTGVLSRPVVTAGEGGIVSLVIDGILPDVTGSLEVSSPAGETVRVAVAPGQTSVDVPAYRVGSNTAVPITVTPYSRFELPDGLGGSAFGPSVTVSGHGIGAPRDLQLSLSSRSDGAGTSTVTARASALAGGDDASVRYAIVRDGTRCTPEAGGAAARFSDLPDGEEYVFTLCAQSSFEGTSYGIATTSASVRAEQAGAAPSGFTFVVDASPNISSGRAEWVVRTPPTSSQQVPNRNVVEFTGVPSTIFDRDPQIQVRYVHQSWGTVTPWATAGPRAGSAPYQVQASWSASTCVGGALLVPQGSSTEGRASISFGNTALRYFDADGAILDHTVGSWAIPVGAVRVDGIGVSVDWSAQGWGLSPANDTFSLNCDPNLPALERPDPGPVPPDPEPAP